MKAAISSLATTPLPLIRNQRRRGCIGFLERLIAPANAVFGQGQYFRVGVLVAYHLFEQRCGFVEAFVVVEQLGKFRPRRGDEL